MNRLIARGLPARCVRQARTRPTRPAPPHVALAAPTRNTVPLHGIGTDAKARQWRTPRSRQSLHARIRPSSSAASLRAHSSRGARAHQAADPRLARLRPLRRRSRMEPHPAANARRARSPRARASSGAPPSSSPRRMPRWSTARRCRASSSTTCIARACCMSARSRCRRCSRSRRCHAGTERPRFPHAPRSPATKSARASACAWGRSTSARAGTRAPRSASSPPPPAPRAALGSRGPDRARARHRRHAVGRADGGAVRRHGQAHACRPLRRRAGSTARCWRASGFTGIVDVFESEYGGFCTTFSRSHDRFNLDELTAGFGERFETMRISLKFYSCVGSNHTTLDAIRDMQARASVQARRCRAHRRARLAGDGRPRRLALSAARAHLGAAEPAVLRRHPADRRRRASSTSSAEAMVADPARMALAEQGRGRARRRPSRRAARSSATWCASRCT